MTLVASTNSPVGGYSSNSNCGYATASANFYLRLSIVQFGDSITEFGFGHAQDSPGIGWASLLASSYTRRCVMS
jgi:hypothetical protein